ncbi:MAG: GAF domain-containing protein [Anaerolineae bacterium]|nr:GAF domain-containing protein [Anaerolineae bacterium]
MRDETKSKEQLINELQSLRDQLEHFKSLEANLRKEIDEREQAETALYSSEERYKGLLNSVTDYIYTVTLQNGHPVATSHGANCVAVTGYTWQEYESNPLLWYQMIHPDDRKNVLKHTVRVMAGEHSMPLEHRIIHKDGSIRWVRNTPVLRRDDQDRVVAYDGLITEITESKQLEERLAMLHKVGQELTRLRDEQSILNQVVEAVVDVFRCEGAGCSLVNNPANQVHYYGRRNTLRLETATKVPVKGHNGHSSYPISQEKSAPSNGHCVPFLPNWSGYPKLFVPLVIGDRVIGILYAVSARVYEFSENDRQLLQTLADQAATAIENARLYQEVRQRAEAEHAAREQADIIREATMALVSSVDLNKVLDSILTHLAQVVPYKTACIFLWDDDALHAVAGRGSKIHDTVVGRRYTIMDGFRYHDVDINGQPLFLINTLLGAGNGDYLSGRMVLPLRVQEANIGYLTLDNPDHLHYSQTQINVAETFANQAAIAIQHARLFKKLKASHEQLQSLSRRMVELQETERRQIARELHDEAGQALTGLMVGLRLLEREVDRPDAVMARVVDLERTTDSVLESLHRLAMNLRPATLEHLGLISALRQYIKGFNAKYEPVTKFEVIGLDDHNRLPLALETNVYRIVQEALTNIIRHAQSTNVDIVLKHSDKQIRLIVEDNGVGFNAKTISKTGRLGLLGMRERAEMLGGTLSVESTIGVGTTILVEVPYDDSCVNS